MARILVACEFSGIVRNAFLDRGHDAWSCDLLPGERAPHSRHLQQDLREVLEVGYPWDILIAHPPCTFLANSSNKHLYIGKNKVNGRDEERWRHMREGAAFFNFIRCLDIPRICMENPIQHCHARALIPKYDQIVQPYFFGHAETKATCLWLKNLPKLVPTQMAVRDREKYPKTGGWQPRVHFESPGPERMKNRSRTVTGLAAAMAAQWGTL